MEFVTEKIFRSLVLPKRDSHKGENGRLLIIAGSQKYHGSLLYALKAASRIVDLIDVLSTKENLQLVRKLKFQTAEFIPVQESLLVRRGRGGHREFGNYDPFFISPSRGEESQVDCVLAGPGMGVSRQTRGLVEKILKSKTKCVLDADALNVLDKKLLKLLHSNCLLTPHRGEFKRLFGIAANFAAAKKSAMRYNCTILLKGKIDVIAGPSGEVIYNKTGNRGMTKGGTGDVLAGLTAAFFCKNNAFISATTAAYLNGRAGDELYRKLGPFYNAEDLVEQIPKTLSKLVKV